MDTTFANWLIVQMQERDWSQSDLARASGLTRQTISYYLSEKSKAPDENALSKIAHAFKLPVEQVYRAAGILPHTPDINETIEQILHDVEGMPEQDQQEILAFIRMKNNLRRQRNKK